MLSQKEYQETHLQLQHISTPVTSKSQRNLRKHLRNRIKEHDLAMQFPPFEPLPHIPYFINRITTEACLCQVIQAATASLEFTIDTESINIYKQTNQPALMQLQIFLPHNSSFVLLIEMYHLPNENNICFKLIHELFKIVFSQNKQLYIWGSKNELYPFVIFKLFSREHIDFSHPINLQNEFHIFWKQHYPHRSSNSRSSNTSTTDCHCETCLGIGLPWSLQNSVKFELKEYLSKQFTNEDFHIGLDPNLYQLNSNEKRYRQQLSTYASYDCLSMQRIIIQMKHKNFIFNSNSIKHVQHDLFQFSPISSDENDDTYSPIPFNPSSINQFNLVDESRALSIEFLDNNDNSHPPQVNSIVICPTQRLITLSTPTQLSKFNDLDTISSNDDDTPFTNTEIQQSPSTSRISTYLLPIHEQLSEAERRKIHNRSCTIRQRRRYYRHEIIRRNIDGRFTITQIKNILRQLYIPFNVVNISRSNITHKYSLYIGLRNPSKLHVYQYQTRYLFTTEHYNELQSTRPHSRSSSHYNRHRQP
ncbi:unnamed protein product [Rotaria sp. Silwood2]|nr:unnamed protein product [Rotaria sp. Silwood2]CAF4624312.1 unnamed protein product [Rotaria sp. Silwood2]